jgi:cytochrome c oxidase subunit 1
MDAYCFTIILFAISTTVAALNIITTVLVLRTKGMTLARLPVFVWGVILSVFLGLTAFPSFLISQVMVLTDRVFQTSFFIAANGGSNWLYEHLFWFMGHPEVYVIALPSMGVAAELSAVFSRKTVFGRRMLLGSLITICILSVLVWGHHLYTSGSNSALDAPYMLDTELISIPTGFFFLALVGTLWRGKIWVTVPLLFVAGMLVNFVVGGITGIYLADLPTDEILHGGMFVTAHFQKCWGVDSIRDWALCISGSSKSVSWGHSCHCSTLAYRVNHAGRPMFHLCMRQPIWSPACLLS